jgi:hypothetical protein
VLAARYYYDRATDSLSHSVVRISYEGVVSALIYLSEDIYQMFLVQDKLAIVCETEVVIVDIGKWTVLANIKLNVAQRFVLDSLHLVSPNITISMEFSTVVQSSNLG